MEHPSRRPRYDSYATPLPALVEARQDELSDRCHAQNRTVRQSITTLLDAALQGLLRRGMFAEVTIRVRIQDGTMQRSVRVEREHRVCGPEDE